MSKQISIRFFIRSIVYFIVKEYLAVIISSVIFYFFTIVNIRNQNIIFYLLNCKRTYLSSNYCIEEI